MLDRKKPIRKIYNPFSDYAENLLCEFDVYTIKGVIDVDLKKIWSDDGVNLCDYLKESIVEGIEDEYRTELNG